MIVIHWVELNREINKLREILHARVNTHLDICGFFEQKMPSAETLSVQQLDTISPQRNQLCPLK